MANIQTKRHKEKKEAKITKKGRERQIKRKREGIVEQNTDTQNLDTNKERWKGKTDEQKQQINLKKDKLKESKKRS